jgi:hypothetical protein
MTEKKEFDYYIDTKLTIWSRDKYRIEANSKEEAEKIMRDIMTDGDVVGLSYDYEYLYETSEKMSVVNNDGNSTKELYDENGTLIIDNKN